MSEASAGSERQERVRDQRRALETAAQPRESLPRVVWTAWLQGETALPPLARRCIDSWRTLNPGWDVRILNAVTAQPFLQRADVPPRRLAALPMQKQSNILRMRLLTEQGGVWADATTFCLKPLDAWLPKCMHAGFFCFRDPGPNRLVANWFLASDQGSRLGTLWRDAHEAFWRDRDYVHHGSDHPYAGLPALQYGLVHLLNRVLNRNTRTTDMWFHPVVRSVLRTYPYCVMHYLFAYGCHRQPEWAALFAQMPWRDAKPVIEAYRSPPGTSFAHVLEDARAAGLPLVKLNWRTSWAEEL